MLGAIEVLLSFLTRQLGLRTDVADPASSVHGKLGSIKIDTAKIGTNTDTRASNTVMGWLNSPVKSVQRGVATLNSVNTLDVTITSVNTSKSMVIATDYWDSSSNSATTQFDIDSSRSYCNLSASTTLQIKRGGTRETVYVAWQVIEFY